MAWLIDFLHGYWPRNRLARISPEYPVWRLTNAGDHGAPLLGAIVSHFPHSRLAYDENPKEDALAGHWRLEQPNVWTVPEDVDVAELFRWLYQGNWFLYDSDRSFTDERIFSDLGSFDARRSYEALQEIGGTYSLYSFHDNDEWCLAVAGDAG